MLATLIMMQVLCAVCRRQCVLLATWCVPGFVFRRTAWQLQLVYPIRGLKFTQEAVVAGGEKGEYMGIHSWIEVRNDGFCYMHTGYYDKKRDVPRKYALPFCIKVPFLCTQRPILSAIGIVSGDMHRVMQVCSTPMSLRDGMARRFGFWLDECEMGLLFDNAIAQYPIDLLGYFNGKRGELVAKAVAAWPRAAEKNLSLLAVGMPCRTFVVNQCNRERRNHFRSENGNPR